MTDAPQLKQLLQTAQQVQQQIANVQEQLARQQVEGAAGGGMVKVVANGRQQVLSVQIDPELMADRDVEMLQDLLVAATNNALSKSSDLASQEMSKVTGSMNLNIPGLTG